jgi:alginate O-acetyltransferase complex protein AlgI
MLFTSAVFVLAFLPITLVGFFALRSRTAAATWLLIASLVFYGYWMPQFTLLLVASIGVNFSVGVRIARRIAIHGRSDRQARLWMICGVAINLALLAYFKYFNFFVDNFALLVGSRREFDRVTLPVGISFFTFTQIAFIVDAWRGKVREFSLVHYGLFVSYFPHLVAGPVLHHAQMMPQFRDEKTYRFNGGQFAAGLAIFAMGLVKKVIFADGVSPYADAVFNPAAAGVSPDMAEAWLAAIAYTLQLYFDFSGYSDMAIGLSWMLNIRLPFNFNSPYRATNISEFWRRWHMSLSNFLRDYLYIALGGNRRGEARRLMNLMTTMLLGGLWHGANWTFVFWGGLHGLYLVVHRLYRESVGDAWLSKVGQLRAYRAVAWLLTILSVIIAWVFFRATTFSAAIRILTAMTGFGSTTAGNGVHELLWDAGLPAARGAALCLILATVALWPINSNRVGEWLLNRGTTSLSMRAALGSAALAAGLLLILINTARDGSSAFIYFNF